MNGRVEIDRRVADEVSRTEEGGGSANKNRRRRKETGEDKCTISSQDKR